jgi:hypothetical protein
MHRATGLGLDELGRFACLDSVQEPANVGLLDTRYRHCAQEGDYVTGNTATIRTERRFGLRPLALSQNEASICGS